MHVLVNGEKLEVFQNYTLADLLNQISIESTTPGVAVALNRQIIFRTKWESTPLCDGDQVDIIQAVQGG